jgi:hypothetical protein
MEELWIVVALLVVAVGLWAAARARAGQARQSDVLAGFGFSRTRDDARVGEWAGRTLELTPHDGGVFVVKVALRPAPLGYATLARALGRGDLLAALHQLDATASGDALTARLTFKWSARQLRAQLDRVTALASGLEAMPQPEGMARWFLELSEGGERHEALARLVAAFPDAPETLDACRQERDQARDPRSATLARAHLERSRSA